MSDSWKRSVEASPEVMDVLDAVAQGQGLHECTRNQTGEVGLGAAPGAYAGVYVNKAGMRLALDPEMARRLVDTGEFTLEKSNDTTHYIRIANASVQDPKWTSTIQQAVESAIERSWQGPRWERGQDPERTSAPARTCPVHHLQLPASGWCDECEDYVP